MGIWEMKFCIFIVFIVAGFSNCTLSDKNSYFSNSSIQIIDMGDFKGLKIIEIASLNYPESTTQTKTSQVFTETDKEYFNDSLILSLKKSEVRVLPSAQTKIHINFTQLAINGNLEDTMLIITADLAVSRNGIITRKTIEITSQAKRTIGATKNNGVKMFIQELGDLLREQSTYKR